MKTKVSKIFSCFGYELGIFIVFCVQAFLNREMIINMENDFYSYYLIDYSMGINARMLVGSVVNLLTDNPTAAWLKGFMIAVLVLSMLGVAILIGQVIRHIKEEYKKPLFVFVLFFVFGTFTMYGFSRYFGLLDVHMFIVALVSIICLQNKYLRWFVPLLSVVGVMVYFSYIYAFFIAVIGAAFYYAVNRKEDKSYLIIFLLSAILCVAATAYCAFEAPDHMFVTFEEMWNIMEQKSGIKFEYEELRPFELFYYRSASDEEMGYSFSNMTTAEMLNLVIMAILGQIPEFRTVNYDGIISLVAIFAVIAAGFLTVWILCIKNSETKLQKFVFACFILAMLVIPVSWLISTDYSRMVQTGVLNQFVFVFFMFAAKDKAFEKAIDTLKSFFKNKEILLVIYFLICASCFQKGWAV